MKTPEHWWYRTKAQFGQDWKLEQSDQHLVIEAFKDAQEEARVEGLREAKANVCVDCAARVERQIAALECGKGEG